MCGVYKAKVLSRELHTYVQQRATQHRAPSLSGLLFQTCSLPECNPSVWAELSSVRKENTEVLSDFQTPISLYESKI